MLTEPCLRGVKKMYLTCVTRYFTDEDPRQRRVSTSSTVVNGSVRS